MAYDPSGSPFNYQAQTNLDRVSQAYQDMLGRAATDGEAQRWLEGGGGQATDDNYVNQRIQALGQTEEAYNYQQKQKQAPAAAAPPPSAQATGSPVSATGQIAPSTQSVTSQMQPAPTPAASGAVPAQARYVQPVDLGSVPAYQAAQFNAPYQAPTGPLTDPTQQSNLTALSNAILTNPQTMSPSIVAQIKEAQKQQALLMQQQTQQQNDQSNVAGGRLGSGFAGAQASNLNAGTLGQILNQNANTDITAAQTNRQNELDALTAGNQSQAQALAAAVAGQNLQLQGAQYNLGAQQAQAGENFNANQAAVNKLLNQFNVNNGIAGNAQQNYTTDLAAQQSQNSQLMDVLKYIEAQRQFNNQLGFNYNSLDQQSQQSLLGYLLGPGN